MNSYTSENNVRSRKRDTDYRSEIKSLEVEKQRKINRIKQVFKMTNKK